MRCSSTLAPQPGENFKQNSAHCQVLAKMNRMVFTDFIIAISQIVSPIQI